jgi:hypothetical protein
MRTLQGRRRAVGTWVSKFWRFRRMVIKRSHAERKRGITEKITCSEGCMSKTVTGLKTNIIYVPSTIKNLKSIIPIDVSGFM